MIITNITTLNRKLFGSRNFAVKSFMHLPSVYQTKSGSAIITASPVVFFSYEPKIAYGEQRPTGNSFKMNPRNQYRVIHFFEEMLSWFNDEKYNDLFIQDEQEGRLLINMDHRNISTIIKGSRFDAQAMLAVPAVITIDSVQHEGCAVSINQTKYTVALLDSDIESLIGMLKTFSFQQEIQLLLSIGNNQNYWSTEKRDAYTGTPKVQW